MPMMARDDLFSDLVVSGKAKPRGSVWLPVSIAGHGIAAALLVLVPIFWPASLPEHPDYIRLLMYNPPPPPPPPLPKGAALVEKPQPVRPTTPDPKPDKPVFTAPIETQVAELRPEAKVPESEQAGSATGSDMGLPEGMDVGIEGGVVGGVPGGVLGGVIGGTGDGPVMDYDQPPRVLKMTRPQYPQDAFVKKIEGTVELEILIGVDGRVKNARVIHSIPLLDAAAIQTVYQWLFAPAVKHGRPVSTVASAPVTFRIY